MLDPVARLVRALSFRSDRKSPRSRRRTLGVEALENRWVPSTTIAVNGLLTLTDSGTGGNHIAVSETGTANQYTVTSDAGTVSANGTTLAGADVAYTFTGVTSITVNTQANSDQLDFDDAGPSSTALAGTLTVNGAGAGTTLGVHLHGFQVTGAFKISDTASGSAALYVGMHAEDDGSTPSVGSLTVTGPTAGFTGFWMGGYTVTGAASFTLGNGGTSVNFYFVSIGGNLTVNAGTGSNSVYYDNAEEFILGPVNTPVESLGAGVGGDVTLNLGNGGNGSNSVFWNGLDFFPFGGVVNDGVGPSTDVGGNMTLNLGTGTNANSILVLETIGKTFAVTQGDGTDNLDFSGFVGGNVSVHQGNGNDQATFGGDFFFGIEVEGSMSVVSGNGSNSVSVEGLIFGNLSLTAGKGNNSVDLDVGVVGNLSVVNGNGNNTVSLSDTDVIGTTKISMGSGTDTVNIDTSEDDGGSTFNGAVSITFGFGGPDTLNIGTNGDVVQFLSTATFSAGKKNAGNGYNVGANVFFNSTPSVTNL